MKNKYCQCIFNTFIRLEENYLLILYLQCKFVQNNIYNSLGMLTIFKY